MNERRLAAVVGVGKGIGGHVARALASRGFDVALFARNESYSKADKLTGLAVEIDSVTKAFPIRMDASQPSDVSRGFEELRRKTGGRRVSCLVYNAGAREMAPVGVHEQDPEQLLRFWKINAFGAFLCAKAVWNDMVELKGGTILFTGATASLRGAAGFSSFGMGKAGLRSLSQSLAQEGAPLNIHVCHFVIDAPVNIPIIRKMTGRTEEELADPKQIAELYMHIIEQPNTCWTSELDVHIKAKL